MPDEVELLLSSIADELMRRLEESGDRVKRIVANLEINEEEYRRLMVCEVINEVIVDAQFAFPPHTLHTPSGVRSKALKLLEKFLERDERLFASPFKSTWHVYDS